MRCPRLLPCIFAVFSLLSKAQLHDVCILDLTSRNAETNNGNLYSVEHIIKAAGYSYTISTSVNEAIRHRALIASSNIESTTFIQSERDSIKNFLSRGGLVILTDMKDALMNPYFGISSTLFATNRYNINFNSNYNDTIFRYFDDARENQISLGSSTDYTYTIGTRAYSLSSGDILATYETGEVAAFHNRYQKGHSYIFGTQFKDVILRPQVKQDYKAARAYSNSFEPAQDVYVFMISGILKRHLNNVVRKHTAPCNFRSALVITHDVDATTSIEMFDDYAWYEKINNISSTYLVTTHYMHDKVAKDFWDDNEQDLIKLNSLGHDLQSHSVSHVPDFDNESVVPMGAPGNNRNTYQPYYDGAVSSNVTVFGEAEVSRDLLQNSSGLEITAFRPGYLAFNSKLINVLDSLNFKFSSSHSANDVMTNFPFMQHMDLSMNGRQSKVLEMPNHISDVFMSDPISEDNFLEKVDTWKTNFQKTYNNHLSSVLLIHPTRYYKLYAQQLLTDALPPDAVITNLSEYGNFWLCRFGTDFICNANVDTMNIYLNKKNSELHKYFSFIVSGGKRFYAVKVYDSDMKPVPFLKSDWEGNDAILHFSCERPAYNIYSITEQAQNKNIYVYPNPSDKSFARLHFETMSEGEVSVLVYDMKGKVVCTPFTSVKFNLGVHELELSACALSAGPYVVKVKIADDTYFVKWINE